ncbi:MAG: tRNA (adenosine(37)-N6)-threonylcarbamoyltransferase complex ATPase subunit type 1 TsaE [Chromatiales bacterium]|nr:tRNA (adenosine(37)-N6)-threonylcarbamoyltransferase complex ATPase subunit type 1 TsaE [Chromatiales bacterium]
MRPKTFRAATEADTEALAVRLAEHCRVGVVYLHGALGSGKTSLVRAWLRARGHTGAVRSPTYTLLETYAIEGVSAAHLDLYRLADPAEVEYLGVRELGGNATALVFIEWPEHGAGFLPPPDLRITIEIDSSARKFFIEPESPAAGRCVAAL